jgi:hypothetical protein
MIPTGKISPFPADSLPSDDKKDTAWGVSAAQAIYGRWYSAPIPYGSGGTVYGNLGYFNMLKSYSEGRQSTLKYKKLYRGEISKPNSSGHDSYNENTRKGYNNIGFDQNSIVSSAPLLISVIKGLLTQSDYKVVVSSTSKADNYLKDKIKWKMYIDAKIVNPLKEELGLPFTKPDWEPQSKAEAELYEKYHGIRLPIEMSLSMIAEHGFNVSDWDKVRDKMIDSALQTSFICGKIETRRDGSVGVKYINPAMYITVWDDDNPEAEPPFAGFIKRVPIHVLKEKLPNLNTKQLEAIARMYSTSNNVSDPTNYAWTSKDPVTQRYTWYDFLVDVLDFEYKTDDVNFYIGRRAGNGNYVYKKEDRPKKQYADGRERKTDKVYQQNIYEGCWIVGSSYIYDYGLQTNMIKNADGSCALSYFSERIAGKSVVERWQSLLDDQQIATLKLRAAILAAAPKGLAIDVGLLANMDLGLGKVSALEIARIRRETGNQFFATRLEVGQKYNGANAVMELENGVGRQLDEWINYQMFIESQMKRIAGITDTASASPNSSPEKLVGIGQMELDSTNNALFNIRQAIIRIKEKAARKIIQKARVNIAGDKTCANYYEAYLGPIYYKAVSSLKDISLNQIGIKLKATTTAQRKAYIMSLIEASLAAGRNGMKGINTADALYVEKTLEEGNDELAAWYLALAEQRADDKLQQNQERMSAINAENSTKSAQAAQQFRAEVEQMLSSLRTNENSKEIADKLQAKLAEIEAQKLADLETMTLEGKLQAAQGREITGKI